MTKNLLLVAALLTASRAFSQNCLSYLFFQKNKTIEMSKTNKKGEPNGKQVYQVSGVTTDGGNTTASIASETFDKNGGSLGKATVTVECNGNAIMVDMRMMLPPQEAEQYASSAKGQAFYLEYPATMKVGDNLKDGSLSMELSASPVGPGGPGGPPGPPPPPGFSHKLSLVISNRKVEAQETVTTPAGTWNCYKISFKSKLTKKTGPFPIPETIEGEEWYAPGVGIVKWQTNKYGTSQITSIK